MLREIRRPNPPTNEEQLASFESRHRMRLPGSFREFLLRTNGGKPVPAAFPIDGLEDNPFGVVQAIFGLNSTEVTEDLDYALTELGINLPRGFVPIGCTEGDDFICIDTRQDGAPVVFWDRRPSWGNNVWSDDDLYPIAENFESFLEALHDREF